MVKIDRARKILYILEEKNYKRERMIIAKIKDSGNSGRNSGSIDIAYCIRYSAIKKKTHFFYSDYSLKTFFAIIRHQIRLMESSAIISTLPALKLSELTRNMSRGN